MYRRTRFVTVNSLRHVTKTVMPSSGRGDAALDIGARRLRGGVRGYHVRLERAQAVPQQDDVDGQRVLYTRTTCRRQSPASPRMTHGRTGPVRGRAERRATRERSSTLEDVDEHVKTREYGEVHR